MSSAVGYLEAFCLQVESPREYGQADSLRLRHVTPQRLMASRLLASQVRMGAIKVGQLPRAAGVSLGEASLVTPVLRFDRVTVRFDEKPALNGISLAIRLGETMVMLGAAGSGKTVLLKTAIGLIQPDEGQVYLFGEDITNLNEEKLNSLRRRVGVLFQEGGLFDSLTVEENVAFPLLNQPGQTLTGSEVQTRVKQEIEFVDLGAALEKYPTELSGGMQRRVGIARASVTKPPLMLFDSPTAGLDPITAFRIVALIIRQRDTRNTTSLIVTHRRQDSHMLANWRYDAQQAKLTRGFDGHQHVRFVVLREGRLVFEGSEDELLSSTDAYISKFAPRFG
jgi:phospholipid/cholesterol/gamma-HCH transport system ATP-binding protein